MEILAPAKINIVLRVLGRRPNGYHDLLMLNERLDVADELTIEIPPFPKGGAGGIAQQIIITCDDPNVPCDERNICYKAAKKLMELNYVAEPFRVPPVDGRLKHVSSEVERPSATPSITIHIKKRIPVAAGLGGGSSDAAAVLKGLNELLELGLPRERLAEIGVKLGADVPFFLYDGAAICEGIGEKITTLGSLPNMWIILINPNFPVATKWVYEEFDKLERAPAEGWSASGGSELFPPYKINLELTDRGRNVSHLRHNFKELGELVKVVHNDLELVTAAKFPEIKVIEKLLTDNGALISWMSGSGPTVVGMFASKGARDLAFEKLNRPEWRVIKTSNC